jgi:hypothetical protein
LTNVAVQKTAPNYNKNAGCKWDLHSLRNFITALRGYGAITPPPPQLNSPEAAQRCFADIQALVLLTLRSVQRLVIQDPHCFELYGFDVLFDDSLKPWWGGGGVFGLMRLLDDACCGSSFVF